MSDVYDVLVTLVLVAVIAVLVRALLKAEDGIAAERQRWEAERTRLIAAALQTRPEVASAIVRSQPKADEPAPKRPTPIGL